MLFEAVETAVSPVTFALAATVQVYVVPVGTKPLVTLTGAAVNAEPEQTAAVMLFTAGVGLTVITTLNGAPAQEPLVGVTTYVTSIGAEVEFVSVPPIVACAVPAAKPEIPVIAVGADQVYVVPVGTILPEPFVGATLNAVPEQIVAA